MPELPEVESVRRALLGTLVGRRIEQVEVRDGRLRWPLVEATLREHILGARFTGFRRRGKYVLADLERVAAEARVLAVHLGMTGWWGVRTLPHWQHDHVVLGLDNGQQLAFNDPRRFGSWHVFAPSLEAQHPLLAHLGREPLDSDDFHGDYLFSACRGRTTTIKERLMDAHCVVGVGNIYASEALFRAGVRPTLRAGRLSRARAGKLASAVQQTLQEAIECGGTTFRDFRGVDGQKGQFTARLRVYGRDKAPCLACQQPIVKVVVGGRSTYYCRRCQQY